MSIKKTVKHSLDKSNNIRWCRHNREQKKLKERIRVNVIDKKEPVDSIKNDTLIKKYYSSKQESPNVMETAFIEAMDK